MIEEAGELDEDDERLLDAIHADVGAVVGIDPEDASPPDWGAMSRPEQEAHYRSIMEKYGRVKASNSADIANLIIIHTPPHILEMQNAKSS